MEVDKQLKFKSHERMRVEFISNNVDVMTHDCLSSVALALMVLYLDRMCQRALHAVLWSHIGTLRHRLAAEPCSIAGLLFHSRCPSGTILLTPYSMVWD